jgi:ABC-type lipoprotein release transport system permease subunit
VVAIALMGLVSALTMGVIERTREIGILRCLGAKARHIRRVFSAEGILLAAVGWAFGVPLGLLLFRVLLIFVRSDIGVTLPAVFPAISLPIALVAVVAVTLTVIRAPLRRATRIQPSSALRYQ